MLVESSMAVPPKTALKSCQLGNWGAPLCRNLFKASVPCWEELDSTFPWLAGREVHANPAVPHLLVQAALKVLPGLSWRLLFCFCNKKLV